MEVTFHGVRGSIPAPGPETVHYGGNTPCVSVRTAAGKLLILDAGTGLVALGRALLPSEFGRGQGQGAILLSHAHWDHIQGFPFFSPIFMPGNRFTVFGPARSSAMLEGILEGQVNPHFSPLYTMKNLGATFELVPMDGSEDRPFEWEGLLIEGRLNPHGRTTCLAYRLTEGERVLVYAPDAGYPEGRPDERVLALYGGADLLIHDATYTPADRAARIERGYSSYEDAARAAVEARVKRLALFHYDQDYTDEQVTHCFQSCRRFLDSIGGDAIQLIAAYEGLTVTL